MEKNEQKNGWWKRKTPGQKMGFIVSSFIFLLCIIAIFLFMDARWMIGDENADNLYSGYKNGWDYLIHKMASGSSMWLLTVLVILITTGVIFVSNFVTHLFDEKSRKAKTVASLIRSLVKYIAIILAVCIIMVIWGVDVAGILAGVGVLTLIIGLGCQSLIQDVVSGLFIVFDDYFAVGDMVIIDGFRGTVRDVGLKTTKLQDFGGNIKSITNSSINTVVNMSRLRSVVTVTLSTSYNEDVERVEALILKEIEQLPSKVPNILEGPWYKGIDNVSSSSIDYLVICFVNEDNRFQVTRDLKREFYMMFKKNDIQIPYPQVTVNPQDSQDRKKATPEEAALADKEQRKLRGLDKPKETKKRINVVHNMKKSLEKTTQEMKDSF